MPSPAGRLAVYVSLRSFLAVGGAFPLSLSRPIGRTLSRAALRLRPRSRERIRTHLEVAFPDLDEDQLETIKRKCADHFGMMLAEVAWLWHAKPRDVESLCELEAQNTS